MLHRGEILEKVIRESGYSITTISQKLGKSRRWMYFLFENPNVPIEVILQIGKIIYHDFSIEFPNLLAGNFVVNETSKNYEIADVNYWKDKYYALVDEHLLVVKQLREYEKRFK